MTVPATLAGPGVAVLPVPFAIPAAAAALALLLALAAAPLQAATCERHLSANVVAFDMPLMYNRLGASNINGAMYALKRDAVDAAGVPLSLAGSNPVAGEVRLRGDKRHRPLVLRVRVGDCLTVNLTNWLTQVANPRQLPRPQANPPEVIVTPAGQIHTVQLDDQPAERRVGFHVSGMELVNGISDDGSHVGGNAASFAAHGGGTASYTLHASREGVFVISNTAATFGSDGNMGNNSNGLFGQLIVEPRGARIYRSQVFEEELRLAADADRDGALGAGEITPLGQPVIRYEAAYPVEEPWASEGKAGLPILNMINPANNEIVHSEINAVIAGPCAGVDAAAGCGGVGHFPKSTYPLESQGKRNPTVPNRLQPFRDFASVFHDETVNGQAFPGFYNHPVFSYVLAGVKDAFMINYGSGGIGSEIIANRLGVGPMHDCLNCAYEEFFLTSFTVGDPALTVDVPANFGLENCSPEAGSDCATVGRKANYVVGAEDPSNVHHSYIGDFVKFRNTHNGKEQHVFHLHNHQWLFNPNDDNSNYLDAQGIGPGAGYTYEINFGGSGNRNKSAGDAIFHCHFYPHFAQGMWYHWRNNDTFQLGTILAATGAGNIAQDADGFASATGYHAGAWDLRDTTPAAGARAYPDGEIEDGTPIPALVPLPGKPMPVMPGRATVVEKKGANNLVLGSNARVIDRDVNPGYPFWIAGMEHSIGQRPPTPPLDMLNKAQAAALKVQGGLWSQIEPAQADGWDGGLPRHTLQGVADGGEFESFVTPLDFSKIMHKAKPVFFPEEGTDLEQVAMDFHARRCHDSYRPDGSPAACVVDPSRTLPTAEPTIGGFITNGGGGPVVGAPFHNPCVDDTGTTLQSGVLGRFFSGETLNAMSTRGASLFHSANPRIYKGTNIQFDAVLTKTGYHYPQQRIVALWQDVGPVTAKQRPPEPLVMRLNTFDCAVYHHSNLVPEYYEIDDYQVRTPTDIIGQHIHLPKWDLTTTDGAGNGWNYEDGTLSPGTVRERIEAINAWNAAAAADADPATVPVPTLGGDTHLEPLPHPFFASVATSLDGGTSVGGLAAKETFSHAWLGARTTTQRWFADPVVNTEGVDRGLGIIFTHDHYGPSTHQQIGLYSTVLTEPAGSRWVHNETGQPLGYDPATGAPARTATATGLLPDGSPGSYTISDGGPTSWQASILPQAALQGANTVQAGTLEPFREFYFEYSDFQHAYEAGVYVGANQMGLPLDGTGAGQPAVAGNEGNPLAGPAGLMNAAEAFRFAINPPARRQINPIFPDLVLEAKVCVKDPVTHEPLLTRPCPQAIDVEDPGMHVVNYRGEPVGLRIYDPAKAGPDGKPGAQADGERGDLAFALQSRTDRAVKDMNRQPAAGDAIHGTVFPPPINAGGVKNGDPFTPMVRTFQGDLIRVKMQAGGHEEEHNASIHGMKWLQAGSGHGKAPNSGWRNAQAGGISEQFTLSVPVVASANSGGGSDYLYTMDASHDGWWSGMWGILRAYDRPAPDLLALPTTLVPVRIANQQQFRNGACPRTAPVRAYDITAALANAVLPANGDVTIQDLHPAGHLGGGAALAASGGTLVYNPRTATVGGGTIVDPETGEVVTLPSHSGPIHDPTAIVFVRTGDLDAAGKLRAGLKPEPVVIRAAAGDCVQVTLRNSLPPLATAVLPDLPAVTITNPDGTTTQVAATGLTSTTPELATLSAIQGIVKRDRFVSQNGVDGEEGATIFDMNLFRASSWVGMTPQLLAFDVEQDAGLVVGENPPGTALAAPGGQKTYSWYAGDISAVKNNGGRNPSYTLTPTPVEFGGASILPADRVKQGAKGLVGALVVQPAGATWVEDADDAGAARRTRTSATVTANGQAFRAHSLVLTKGLTQFYADGYPVEHMNGEGLGIPEDSQESSGLAVNYGVEPAWFRFGILPQSPFGNCAGCYGGIANAGDYYSNGLAGGDPATPVLVSRAGQPTRIHISVPYGTSRGSTFSLHGHVWQRDPYVCPGQARNGLPGACEMASVGSLALGENPMGFAQGGQESWNAPTHFDIVLPSAGGGFEVPGDYLFRDHASFGNASGLWGIFRVTP